MFEFMFINRLNERLSSISSNSRQQIGKGSKKSSANGSRHASWQNNFKKNTLSVSSCPACDRIYLDCINPITYITNPDTSFSACKYKAICSEYFYTYCNDPLPLF
jgi:hypothetical protein